jgi:hypothetical protein
MSYFINPAHPELIFFGESQEADAWIKANVTGAERHPAAVVDPTPPTEVHPGVLRYLAP